MPLSAEQFQRQQASQGVGGWDHSSPGEPALADNAIERHRRQRRQEQKQAAELGANGFRLQAQGSRVRVVGGSGFGARRTLVVLPSGQPGKSLLLEHFGDSHRSSLDPFLLQSLADVVNGLVLLPQLNDLLLHDLGRLGPWAGRFGEELAGGILAELMGQLPHAAHGIAKAAGNFRGGHLIDKAGPQGFVLPMRGVLGGQKYLSQVH